MGAEFKPVRSSTVYSLKSLGNTSKMKSLMTALDGINEVNGKVPGIGGWTDVKDAIEKFGFSVVYDRNLALITVALFAAIARSNCPALKSSATAVMRDTANNKQGQSVSLGQAFIEGDGKAIYGILNKTPFRNILSDIGVSDSCAGKYINRMKRITSWKLGNSKDALAVVKTAFEEMTGDDFADVNVGTEIVTINKFEDFERLKQYKDNVVEVTIVDGITEIPDHAFSECKNLETITIPNSVTEIGCWAFERCEKLRQIDIPDSVKDIGLCAFTNCTLLKKIKLPSGINTISANTFDNCFNLEEVLIPEGVTGIGEEAFAHCQKLKKISIPSSVATVGKGAFAFCVGIKKILGNPRPEIKKAIQQQIG